MKKEISVEITEDLIVQGTDLVYMQKPFWCDAAFYPLKMSLLRPRRFFRYDREYEPLPVIVWVTGGGWTEVEHNVWLPELTYYAKQGFLVASVSYSTSPTWTFPEPIREIRQAIRYLRAHAAQLHLDPTRIAVMGESAGGYYAAMAAVTGGAAEFDTDEYAAYSSRVQAAVCFYPAIDMMDFECRGELASYDTRPQGLLRGETEPQSLFAGVEHLREHPALGRKMDPRTYLDENTPPMLLLHGTADTQVNYHHSIAMYEALQAHGIASELLLVDGAEHADPAFVQPAVKRDVVAFLRNL